MREIIENMIDIKELDKININDLKSEKILLNPDLDIIQSNSLETLTRLNDNKNLDMSELKSLKSENIDIKIIKEETGWSDEITKNINSMEEYKIYKEANLKEAVINGQKCLIRDIDFNQKDNMGRTNKERMESGLSPLDKSGKPIELHHIGQHSNSPLAELTMAEHRGKGNDIILHNKTKESEINREEFAIQRSNHWKNRT